MVERFAEANLELVVVNRPLVGGRGSRDIVQVDIQRKLSGNMRDEIFQLYVGDETADRLHRVVFQTGLYHILVNVPDQESTARYSKIIVAGTDGYSEIFLDFGYYRPGPCA